MDDYSDYDARSRTEVIALISRQAKRIAELEARVRELETQVPDDFLDALDSTG